MAEVVVFNKPYDVLSQFTDPQNRSTLSDYINLKGFYPAGRLDRDSEGLLLLTNNGQLAQRISHPRFKQAKTYWVQVEGEITDEACAQLSKGVVLNDGMTLPAHAKKILPPTLWPRSNPVRYRENIPTSWIELTLKEGRNRQVRRMTAAVNFPTLRLVRAKIGTWQLDGLNPGEYRVETVHMPEPPAQATKRPSIPSRERGAGRNQSTRRPQRKR